MGPLATAEIGATYSTAGTVTLAGTPLGYCDTFANATIAGTLDLHVSSAPEVWGLFSGCTYATGTLTLGSLVKGRGTLANGATVQVVAADMQSVLSGHKAPDDPGSERSVSVEGIFVYLYLGGQWRRLVSATDYTV